MRILERSIMLLALIVAAAGVFALAVSAGAKEEPGKEVRVPLEKAPQPVRVTLDAKLPGVTGVELTCEKENGFTSYEAEYTADGSKRSMVMTEDGVVTETEQEVPIASLPAAVAAEIKKGSPKGQITGATQVVSTYYEITVKTGVKEKEVKVYANGRPVEDDD